MAASDNQFVASLRPPCSQALPGDVGHVLENYVGHSLAHVGERLDLLDLQHDWCTDLTGMVPSDEDFLMDVVSFSAK